MKKGSPARKNVRPSMLHLSMAACWMILGSVLLAWHQLGGTGIPLGWFALAMALYNILRWWMDHSSKKAARTDVKESQLPCRAVPAKHPRPTPARDPTFDFTTDPP